MANPDFGKMVGPLPLGAWVAVVGGGFLFMVYQKKQAAIVPATATADPTQAATDPNLVGDGGSGQFVDVTPPSDSGGVAPAITDNDSWGRAAINWLIGQGYDPIVSDSAIRKYLDQEVGYSASEYALVRAALGHLGPPPVPLPAPVFGKPVVTPPKPPVTSKPPAKPPTKKPAPKPHIRYYTVRPGDNLTKIGAKYHVSWQSIYNANKHSHRRADGSMGMITNYNVIRPGWHLIIPNS
jgi:nucleoid-associated protein YgaU